MVNGNWYIAICWQTSPPGKMLANAPPQIRGALVFVFLFQHANQLLLLSPSFVPPCAVNFEGFA